MKNWFQNLGYKMQGWMQGRYGQDELNRALSTGGLILLLLSMIPALSFLYPLAFAMVVWSIFRCYSKKLDRRRAERDAYLRFTGKIKGWFSLQKRRWKERRTHRYFRCKQCRASLRVPRGKGKIRITCPHCGCKFEKKT